MSQSELCTPESLRPRHGVVTLYGFGTKVSVDRGHLHVEDGIGPARRFARFAKVKNGLRRLVVIGSDGFVSFAALPWLADQDASFVMLDRLGKVLLTTGPVSPSDSRLRRAQALAHTTGAALEIAKKLIEHKLVGQEEVIRIRFDDSNVADQIGKIRTQEVQATSIQAVRNLEAQAAQAYWSGWSELAIIFPKRDLTRVPTHWLKFGTRKSAITGSPRRATNPANAMLNYLYALLEAESRLAVAALGLDPGLGVLHMDAPVRDSLACDLMESVRPLVDAYVYDWVTREPLSRAWFYEDRDGNCRLMAKFAERLSETTAKWASSVAPHAEWMVRRLAHARPVTTLGIPHPTRLTHSNRRRSNHGLISSRTPGVDYPKLCATCGEALKRGKTNCARCSLGVSAENLRKAAEIGRIAAHSKSAEARRASTHRKQQRAVKNWNPSTQPSWLNDVILREKIVPRLREVQVPLLSSTLGVSEPYATAIRRGTRTPHPRHWVKLARLVNVTEPGALKS